MVAQTTIPRPVIFRFDNHWMRIPECAAIIGAAWSSVSGLAGTGSLSWRLKRGWADLKHWKKSCRSPMDLLRNCNIVIAMMDLLEEHRPLFHAEFVLRNLVKDAAREHAA